MRQYSTTWNSQDFFDKGATVETVTTCLEAGADPNARERLFGVSTECHSGPPGSTATDSPAAIRPPWEFRQQ